MSAQKCEFQSKVLEKKPCFLKAEVEIPVTELKKELEEVFNSIKSSAKLPGFRAGKVPMDMVKKEYDGIAKERLIENLIKKTAFNALEKENFAPIDMPKVSDINFENEDKPFKYVFEAECHPDIKAKDYKDIEVKKEKFKVTDKNIDANIKVMLDRNARLIVSKDDTVKKDSFVLVDYEGFCDGVEVKEIKAKEYLLDLGAENTLKGFKEGLVGAKKGEQKDIEIEYPKDYPNKMLQGKKVLFKTKIVEIKEKQLPELNDDFAKDMGLENLDDLKKKMKDMLEQEEIRRQNSEVEKQIIECLLDKNKFDVPKTLVLQQQKVLTDRMSDYMKRQGAPQDFINKQLEQSKDKYADEADKNVRLSYILNSIYSLEKLNVSQEDLEAEKQKMLNANPSRKEDVEKYFNEHKEDIGASLKEDKLFKFLTDNAKITETEKEMPVK